MFEKVNPMHPDKIADRIAGAIVDMAYIKEIDPKIAVEVLIGHNECFVIVESSVFISYQEVEKAVERITGRDDITLHLRQVKQDVHLANNQKDKIRCGDNGIFKGVPTSSEERYLSINVREFFRNHPTDGKYIIDENSSTFIVCQSHMNEKETEDFKSMIKSLGFKNVSVNPLGPWIGGLDTDSGATNRKLGSDMGRGATGGGLMGKDCSKADVSVNIYAYLKAQKTQKPIELHCAIGDETVDGKPYEEIVKIAKDYIASLGGFEKFAEWGLI